jgi:O-acetyl-ADP-ribose deacetylase (regulator of RNase III)
MATAIEIDVWLGEIAELEVDALIIPANESLFMTAGPAVAVKRMGGDEIELAAVEQGPIRPGAAIATTGGRLAAPYVIHAAAVGHDLVADPSRLDAALRSALAFCTPLQLRRVAIAGLGTERGAFAPDEAAAILLRALRAHAAENDLPESVVFALATSTEARAFAHAAELSRAEV